VPNACGFWLSLWVFIDSYELALKEAVAADGQQVAVFHSRLCPNIHTNYLTVSKNFPWPLFSLTWVRTQHWVPNWTPAFCQKGRLCWCRPYIFYRIYTGQKELWNEDGQAEKADWWHDWLAAVGFAGHGHGCWWCHRPDQWPLHAAGLLQYTYSTGPCGDHVTWFLIPCPLVSHSSFFIQVPIIPKEIPE